MEALYKDKVERDHSMILITLELYTLFPLFPHASVLFLYVQDSYYTHHKGDQSLCETSSSVKKSKRLKKVETSEARVKFGLTLINMFDILFHNSICLLQTR